MVHGFIQKGEWNNSKEKTIDESVVNEGINAKDIKDADTIYHSLGDDILDEIK